MTTISGMRYYKCPKCNREINFYCYGSYNTFGYRLWSDGECSPDGRVLNSPIAYCEDCKKYYFRSQLEFIEEVPLELFANFLEDVAEL